MKKQFENTTEVNTKELFDAVHLYAEVLLREATGVGALDPIDVENEYTRELGRVLGLLAEYEDKHVAFEHISFKNAVHKPVENTPLIRRTSRPRKVAYA
ncbi:MAG: hypothetical protein LBS63_03330 [Prevotellaceae bacterium]|jgi:hypothetical protein|nr:hypothetical protein [Prevotellaceae bacterium]